MNLNSRFLDSLRRGSATLWLPLLFAIVCLLAGESARQSQHQDLERIVERRAQVSQSAIVAQTQTLFLSISRIAKHLDADPHMPEQLWRYNVQLFLDDHQSIGGIARLDAELQPVWTQSGTGEFFQTHLSFSENDEVRSKLKGAQAEARLELWGPVQLNAQESVVYAFAPISDALESEGYIVAQIYVTPLLDEILGPVLSQGFTLAVSVRDQRVYLSNAEPLANVPVASFRLDVDGDKSGWRFAVSPGPAIIRQIDGPLPELIWFAGCCLALLFWLVLHAQRTTREKTALLDREWRDHQVLQTQFQQMSTRDALTGLLNRHQLENELEHRLSTDSGFGDLTLSLVDLDNFKDINSGQSYAAGDQILRQTGVRLQNFLGSESLVARVNGNEFALCYPCSVDDTAGAEILQILSKPYVVGNHTIRLTASIGTAVFPDDGPLASDLLTNASAALGVAKAQGRNRCIRYTRSMKTAAKNRAILLQELRDALKNEEFEMWFQPRCSLKNGTMLGAEALLRWRRANGKIETPDNFLPLLEESGLVVPVGLQTIERAITDFMSFTGKQSVMMLSVNLSARQLAHPNILEDIKSILQRSGMQPQRLELELTEQSLIQDIDHNISVLTALRSWGVNIAVDDFGTGYSSLAYLKKFPVNVLKIDRSFVTGLPNDAEDLVIVRTVIAMGNSLGMTVVAEGVETEAQFRLLAKNNCAQAQGHYLSPALSRDRFVAYLDAARWRTSPRRGRSASGAKVEPTASWEGNLGKL